MREDNGKKLISLDNYERYEATHNLNSPRSLEACRREGVNPKALRYKTLDSFAAPGKPPALQEAEFEQYEKNRQRILLIKIRNTRRIRTDPCIDDSGWK